MNDNFYVNLGNNIRNRRKQLGLSQQELAEKINISLNFMGKIEVAFSKPSLDTLVKIADGLNISVSELCDFNQNSKNNI